MFEKRRPNEQTRIIFVRHLDTQGRLVRQNIKDDPRYKLLLSLYEKRRLSTTDLQKANALGSELLAAFGFLPPDMDLPILEGQEALGRAMGEALANKYGVPDRWEVSPYRRAQQTSHLLREGVARASSVSLPPELTNPQIYEKNVGASDEYPSVRVYLATHPKELKKFLRDPEGYAYPHGESRRSFKRRMRRNVRALKRKREYEGQTTVIVAHSLVMEEHIRQLLGLTDIHENIPPGSTIVIEADPKRFLRARRFRLVSQIGEKLVA